MRVAAIDLGTNTTRLLVADVQDARVKEVEVRTEITRLGEGVDSRRRLLPLPIARVRNVLTEYRRRLEAHGAERTLLVATSAVRDAENGEAFLGEIEWSYGFATRMLSGEEEALLSFRGALIGDGARSDVLVLDVGGGSTELILGNADALRLHTSVDVGSVRVTERFLASDPPAAEELESCRAAIRSALAEHVPGAVRMRVDGIVGVGGTITSIAAIELGLAQHDRERVHGHRVSRATIDAQLQHLAALPLAERRLVPGLHPDRAPVIVGGVAIVLEVLDHFALPGIDVSERDLLHGAALEAAKLPAATEGPAPPGAYTCC